MMKDILSGIFGGLGSILRSKTMIAFLIAVVGAYYLSSNLPDVKYEIPTPAPTLTTYKREEKHVPTPTVIVLTPTPTSETIRRDEPYYCKKIVFGSGYNPPCPEGWGFREGIPGYWRFNVNGDRWEFYGMYPNAAPGSTPTPIWTSQ